VHLRLFPGTPCLASVAVRRCDPWMCRRNAYKQSEVVQATMVAYVAARLEQIWSQSSADENDNVSRQVGRCVEMMVDFAGGLLRYSYTIMKLLFTAFRYAVLASARKYVDSNFASVIDVEHIL
jgi:hypothetical protein